MIESVLSVSSEPGYIWLGSDSFQTTINNWASKDGGQCWCSGPNDDINSSAPGGDFQSVLDDDMVPFEQVRIKQL